MIVWPIVVLVSCMFAALLLQHVNFHFQATDRRQCNNNLRQIARAFLNYHDVYKTFPPAYIPDDNGQPMHSCAC